VVADVLMTAVSYLAVGLGALLVCCVAFIIMALAYAELRGAW
jgi:hypothetical protein